MTKRHLLLPLLVTIIVCHGSLRADENPLRVFPAEVTLAAPNAQQQLLVTRTDSSKMRDLTRECKLAIEPASIAAIDAEGVLRATGDGVGEVVVTFEGAVTRVPITVSNQTAEQRIDFELDVQPILTKFGCNSGPCHGKQRGQNGFQLSLLGFDPNFDFDAITKEGRGRRVFPAAADESLLLKKAAGDVPHGGGTRLPHDSHGYAVLRDWIRSGMPRRDENRPRIERIEVFPKEQTLAHHAEHQLAVTAHYADGTTQDVTHMCAFQSNESAIASVTDSGRIVASTITGESAVMARFMHLIDVCNVIIPLENRPSAEDTGTNLYETLPQYNFIDGHVWTKLEKFGLLPSPEADDATFARRAYLDAIGRLPRPEETREFLADTGPDKRSRLVARLLERPEYADFWANKWADLLRPNPYRVGIKAVRTLDAWLRDAFRQNLPHDEFTRQILTAQGSTFRHGPVVVFRDRREPDEITTMVSQLFLGIRMECAKCHHHPFEVWAQEDFYGLAAYFARIGRKGTGLSPPISGSEEIFFPKDSGGVRHPITNEIVPPKPLLGEAPDPKSQEDLRAVFTAWLTTEGNMFLARVAVNRIWADLMGRGLVDPVDDMRATNPPTNGPLLEALAKDFIEHQFDNKHLLRTIMTSYVYGLSTLPNETNVVDTRNYSRRYRRRPRAEVLLDAVSDITGIPESFAAMPPGSRSMELWTHRSGSLFLDTFGRPDLNQDPPCERTSDTTVVQALHLMNSPELHKKVIDDAGTAAKLAASERSAAEIVEEVYLLTYCRFPSAEEKQVAAALFDEPDADRRAVTEDLLWALINSPEFVFID